MAVTLKQYAFSFNGKKYIVEAGSRYNAMMAIENKFNIVKTPREVPFSANTTNLHHSYTNIYEA